MAGATLGIGVMTVAAALTMGLAAVSGAAALGQRVAGAADAAALAAADTVSGAVPATGSGAGDTPCRRAAQVAATMGASVDRCDVAELVVTVVVSAPFGVLRASAAARAGPAP